MFNPTIIIYIYVYIIISLIVFDIFYTLNEKFQEKRSEKKLNKYKEVIWVQIEKMDTDSSIDKEHVKKLSWKLRGVNNLLIYQEAIRQLKEKDLDRVDAYLVLYANVFQFFANFYGKRDSIYKAFFAMFLAKYYPFYLETNSMMDEAIMKYVEFNSIYCRENAMLYFYERGSSRLVVEALKKIDEAGLYYNKKLLSNDLLKFKGDRLELAKQLFEYFDNFSVDFQVSIINYLKFSNVSFNAKLFAMLESGEYDKEVDLAIIRYFGKYIYKKALPYFLGLLEDDSIDVEYRIVVCQMISVYDCVGVRKALIACVSNSNWYVRKNAAKSLVKLKLTVADKKRLESISDRYGKQMIEYTFKSAKMIEEKKEVEV